MTSGSIRPSGLSKSCGNVLDSAAELFFLLAFFLICFKLFWSLAGEFSLSSLDVVLAWPMPLRIVGLIVIALVVAFPCYLLFGDRERPGWLVLAELGKHPLLRNWLGLIRRAGAVVASFALVKLIWLTGQDGSDTIDWWYLVGELMRRF